MTLWLWGRARSLLYNWAPLIRVHPQFLGHVASPQVLSAIIIVIFAIWSKKFVDKLRAVNYLPGMRVPFQPLSPPGVLLRTRWWNPSTQFTWKWRSTFYKRFGIENVSIVPFIFGGSSIYTTNMDVARQVLAGGHKSSFIKPPASARPLLLFGENLITTDGEMWRRHRRIIGAAFTRQLHQRVWYETLGMYRQMITAEGWATKDIVDVPVVQTLTFKLALLIISKCGFGLPTEWALPPSTTDGDLTVQEALRTFTDRLRLFVFTPKWVWSLPLQFVKKARQSYEQLYQFMKAEVTDRRSVIRGETEPADGQNDVFTMLVRANEQESTKLQLSDDELMGNVYALLLAGHETTAQTLAATLGSLAFYEDVQNEVYEQIASIVGDDRDPTFEDYSKLDKVLAAFYEALRMFPPGFGVVREAAENTVLHIPGNALGQEGTTALPVEKGTLVFVDIIGLLYNPRYFDEPEKYKPSRWYGESIDSEAMFAFSVGARACPGRKFATTEAVAFLTMLLRDWKVEPVLKDEETREAWRDRVLEGHIVLTLGVKDVPVKLIRRTKRNGERNE